MTKISKSGLYFCILISFLHACAGDDTIEGPCRRWYRSCKDHEVENQWECTSVEEYIRYTVKGCPHDPLVKIPPPPAGRCLMVNDVCQFDTSSTLKCAFYQSRMNLCQYKCVAANGIDPNDNCSYTRYLPPDTLCIPINEECQEYSPCKYWKLLSTSAPFQCGTFDDYYKFKFSPHLSHARLPKEHVDLTPPGECILQNSSCSWSKCLAHMDLCLFNWMCGSAYDAAVYYSLPPHTCPQPPPGTTPPPQPGKCVFNMTANKCVFEKETSYDQEAFNEKHT